MHTLNVHLVLDGMGKERYIKASKVTDFFSQYVHVTVDLNKPYKDRNMVQIKSEIKEK